MIEEPQFPGNLQKHFFHITDIRLILMMFCQKEVTEIELDFTYIVN